MRARAFHFNASACSGCKACQVACRDRNGLPAGVRWRRVYEVAGGGWRQDGGAWVNDVVAWNVSMSCNHCEQAECVRVCPTGAMHARSDGVVLVDHARCVGCRYCEWACQWGAPQFDAAAGVMTKCTLCIEDLEQGTPPACVAACPLRALELVEDPELTGSEACIPLMHPLPPPLTTPRLAVVPHAASRRAAPQGAAGAPRVMNREEVIPAAAAMPLREWSLVAFTLLGQAAAGVTWALLALRLFAPSAAAAAGVLPVEIAALLLFTAGAAALLHLSRRGRAWRALLRAGSSPLSREVAAAFAFAAGCVLLLLLRWTGGHAGSAGAATLATTAAAGAAFVTAMAAVYRLPAVPSWNSPLTTVSFVLTAAGLGALITALALVTGAGEEASAAAPWVAVAAVAAVIARLVVRPAWRAHRVRAAAFVDHGLFPAAAVGKDERGEVWLYGGAAAFAALAALALLAQPYGLASGSHAAATACLAAALALSAAAAFLDRTAFFRCFARRGL
jgi:anaerobic dimethyl sulfoxide reductase subunit B